MAYRVSAIETIEYTPREMDRAVRHHFDAFGMRYRPDWQTAKVVLKPNLLMKRAPDEATTTHPELVAAVVRCLKDLGATDITIADSPGGPFSRHALEGIYKATGMAQVAAETGARLNTDVGYKTVPFRSPDGICHSYNIINVIEQADVVINLPKLKTHAMTTLSGGVKNLFGCIPGLQKPEFHLRFPEKERFARMLVELAQTVNPQLTIIDAVVSMEGDGPSSGSPKFTGWTLACDDVAVLDAALCYMIGLPADEVGTVAYTQSQGVAPVSEDEIEYIGSHPTPIVGYKLPSSHNRIDFTDNVPPFMRSAVRRLGNWLTPKPSIKRGKCIGCGKCAESCPANVIDMVNKKASIRYENCIKCFCCHEMCPVRAIGIKRII